MVNTNDCTIESCITDFSGPSAPAEIVAVAAAPVAAEVPTAVVVPPAAATVKVPQAVSVPQAATVPSAVPSGGGSSAPASLPMWALALIVVGALGAVGSSVRLAGSRTK